jgi:hypothetical protein
MRSAIQANRGQASILQGLPAETPETPVLISKIYQFFLIFQKKDSFNICVVNFSPNISKQYISIIPVTEKINRLLSTEGDSPASFPERIIRIFKKTIKG